MARPRKIVTPEAKVEATEAPSTDGLIEIVCVTHNVHLGDGRKLGWQEGARVTPELADLLVTNKQVKRV